METDIQIARLAKIKKIESIAAKIKIKKHDLELYGKYKAKLPLKLINRDKIKKSNLVLITSINPTPAGEGKTTVSVGLVDGLKKIGKNAMAVLREPSLGPVFGLKGGAAGGGQSQVIPMEDINLHFTGDFAAIEKANNFLSALIDNNLQSKKNNLNIDQRTITWKRVLDVNDRSLRKITIGLGGVTNGIPREEGFNITAASEIMAILCMSQDLDDLKQRLGNIFVGFTHPNDKGEKKAIFACDLNAQEAMTILLRDAIKPNLVQTLEGNPVILHGGPFANIAQGTNSIIATKMAMSLSKLVVTEAGFGADLGAEKFLNLKCRSAKLKPSLVVIVATVRALRHHGGANKKELDQVSLERVKIGFPNLKKHIENIKKFGLPCLVTINCFPSDSKEELNLIKKLCDKLKVKCIESHGFSLGGEGMIELAKNVVKKIGNKDSSFKYLYDLNKPAEEKITIIAKEIYGASDVVFSTQAKNDLKKINRLKIGNLPICIAKTQKSLSDNEKLLSYPQNFVVTIREIEIATGAGFLIPILGNMMRMPGLPEQPASENMSISSNGEINGLG